MCLDAKAEEVNKDLAATAVDHFEDVTISNVECIACDRTILKQPLRRHPSKSPASVGDKMCCPNGSKACNVRMVSAVKDIDGSTDKMMCLSKKTDLLQEDSKKTNVQRQRQPSIVAEGNSETPARRVVIYGPNRQDDVDLKESSEAHTYEIPSAGDSGEIVKDSEGNMWNLVKAR